MATEIERKFLLSNDSWRAAAAATGVLFRQGYLSIETERTVRVRLEGELGKLTIKGKTSGCTRSEYEYPIPPGDAAELLDRLCLQPLIEKTRYRLESAGQLWELDEFHGLNTGLLIAEIELTAADQPFVRPAWLGTEVTADPRYYNANLVKNPFAGW